MPIISVRKNCKADGLSVHWRAMYVDGVTGGSGARQRCDRGERHVSTTQPGKATHVDGVTGGEERRVLGAGGKDLWILECPEPVLTWGYAVTPLRRSKTYQLHADRRRHSPVGRCGRG